MWVEIVDSVDNSVYNCILQQKRHLFEWTTFNNFFVDYCG